MTTNQLIVLLDSSRRELKEKNHLGSFKQDVRYLKYTNLLDFDDTPTPKGYRKIRAILELLENL